MGEPHSAGPLQNSTVENLPEMERHDELAQSMQLRPANRFALNREVSLDRQAEAEGSIGITNINCGPFATRDGSKTEVKGREIRRNEEMGLGHGSKFL